MNRIANNHRRASFSGRFQATGLEPPKDSGWRVRAPSLNEISRHQSQARYIPGRCNSSLPHPIHEAGCVDDEPCGTVLYSLFMFDVVWGMNGLPTHNFWESWIFPPWNN